jgi:HPt (histidine-containing phosphotransfer) domain-containing protein
MDLQALEEELGLDRAEIMEMVQLFVETTCTDLDALEAAVRGQDYQRVTEAAHSIKGVSANFRLTEIYETAGGIERRAREKRLEGVMEDVSLVREKVDRIRETLLKAHL